MNRLLDIGFEKIGYWELKNKKIKYTLNSHAQTPNILYAFVHKDIIKYIGETIQLLQKRMYGYQNPGPSQTTNIKNNAHILRLLKAGEEVDIYALPDNGLFHYGNFHLNLAAGLEVSLINTILPSWNSTNKNKSTNKKLKQSKISKKQLNTSTSLVIPACNKSIFKFSLQTTYYKQGFFNVSKQYENLFGLNGQKIYIYCGNQKYLINGFINRSANTNNTPRIMGRVELRDWFQANYNINDKIVVTVLSPVSIWIK